MPRPKKSIECASCKWFHKGINVDHNHCDFQGRYDHYLDWHERRANGQEERRCYNLELVKG